MPITRHRLVPKPARSTPPSGSVVPVWNACPPTMSPVGAKVPEPGSNTSALRDECSRLWTGASAAGDEHMAVAQQGRRVPQPRRAGAPVALNVPVAGS